MKMLVLEAATAGLLDHYTTYSLLPDGLAMLQSISRDFISLGYKTTTLVSRNIIRFLSYKPTGLNILKTDRLSISNLRKIALDYDWIYVIAPEENRVLQNILYELDNRYLNSNPETIDTVANKKRFIEIISKSGYKTPKTITVNDVSGSRDIRDLNIKFPLILKPSRGAGCEGLTIVRNKEKFQDILRRLVKKYHEILVQEYIRGLAASVSLVSDDKHSLPLSLNRQFIKLSDIGQSKYLGGYTPLKHEYIDKIFEICKDLIMFFKGLYGYVGIDIIISNNKVYIIEVNPRLTVSYTGLSKVLSTNPAYLIIKSITNNLDPNYKIYYKGVSYYRKVVFQKGKTMDNYHYKLRRTEYVLTPPIRFSRESEGYSYIEISADNIRNAVLKADSLLKRLSYNTGMSIFML